MSLVTAPAQATSADDPSPPRPRAKGPWTHRALIAFFSVLFGVLVFWLLGFVLDDIGTWPGPSYEGLEQSMLDRDLVRQQDELARKIADTTRQIEGQRQRQQILGESTTGSQRTMNQLLEFQKLALEKQGGLSDEEKQALAEAERLFLTNQKQFQQLNEEVAGLSNTLRELQEQQRGVEAKAEAAREPIRREFDTLWERHQLRIAGAKLGVLLPLVLVAVGLFVKFRRSLYAPLIHAFGIAVLVWVGMVMHEYFPSRYFKYVLVLVSLAVVAAVLVNLLRAVAFPKRDWLLRRYREAYERFACPVCDHPIRRGPLRYLPWTRRGFREAPIPTESIPDEPYTCPSCGTGLFEECAVCHKARHSLLPACEKCGAEKPLPLVLDRQAAVTTTGDEVRS